MNNWNIKSFEHTTELASAQTQVTGKLHIACDRGEYCSPRFHIEAAPVVGEEVSYAFNGDYYPCGTIAAISKSLKLVTTSTGRKFYRRGQSGAWLNNGMWSLVSGTHSRLNPEF